jgi:hypothetical protein
MLSSRRIYLAPFAVCLWLFVLSSTALAAGPATVTVRVEGLTETKLPTTQVTTTTTPLVKDGNPAHFCSGTSAAGALELATHGNWGGTWFSGFGYSVESIEGESLPFSGMEYWSYWLDNKPATAGICEGELSAGDSILLFPECFGECPGSPNPLGIEAPAIVEAGQPVTVTVTSYNHASGAPSPADHVKVTYEGSITETDPSGHATLKFATAGDATVQVAASEAVRAETSICVHAGNDGRCGTTAGSGSTGSTTGNSATTGTAGSAGVDAFSQSAPYKGPYALVADASGLIEGHTYGRGRAPRVLSGSILAHSAVSSVGLKLRREYRGRCHAYSGTKERFLSARCGEGSFFKVSSDGSYSYLLPAALAPGRYVLDIQASDAAGNRTTLARGTSRIVFHVR